MKQSAKWVNHAGEEVPQQYVSKYDKKKEAVVGKLHKKAAILSKAMREFKKEADLATDTLYTDMFALKGMERSAKSKGNATFFSFDKRLKVEVAMDEVIDFDEKITLAQVKIQEFLQEKTKGADTDLITLVNGAFTTKRGRLDKARVFSLFSLDIRHAKWQEAMALIRESIAVNNKRKYILFSVRDETGRYIPVQLNWSSL